MRHILSFTLPILLTAMSCLYAQEVCGKQVSLRSALASKLITLRTISNGGYCGKSIKLILANNTKDDFDVDVDPGLIFVPADTSYQNLVLMGNESFALGSGKNTEVDLQTFCGKSYAHCPKANISYKFWRQGDSNMIKMLTYAKNNNLPINLVQRAVWTFTNAHCLSTVYSSLFPNVSERFIKYIASVKNVAVPELYTEYALENVADRPVIVYGSGRTFINMHWGTEGYRNMYLTIYKDNGEIYKEIEADRVIDKNGYTVAVEFDPKRDMPGTYLVKLHDNMNRTWEQRRVIIGPSPCDMP